MTDRKFMTGRLKKALADGWISFENHSKFVHLDKCYCHWWDFEGDVLPTLIDAVNYLGHIHLENNIKYSLVGDFDDDIQE